MRGDGYNSLQVPLGKGNGSVDAYIFSDAFNPVYTTSGAATSERTVAVDYNTNETVLTVRFKTSWVPIYIPLRVVVCRAWRGHVHERPELAQYQRTAVGGY